MLLFKEQEHFQEGLYFLFSHRSSGAEMLSSIFQVWYPRLWQLESWHLKCLKRWGNRYLQIILCRIYFHVIAIKRLESHKIIKNSERLWCDFAGFCSGSNNCVDNKYKNYQMAPVSIMRAPSEHKHYLFPSPWPWPEKVVYPCKKEQDSPEKNNTEEVLD